MESPKKNSDTMNNVGIITVGVVGSALVYLSIVGLQAFYVDETAIVDEVSQFGDQEKVRSSLKANQVGNITTNLVRKGWSTPDNKPVVSIPIEIAKQLVVRDARADAAYLVPAVGRSETATIQPVFGRPLALPPPPPPIPDPVPAPADGTVPGVVPPDGLPAGTPATPPAGAGTPPAGATPPGATAPTPGVPPATPPAVPAPTPAPAGGH